MVCYFYFPPCYSYLQLVQQLDKNQSVYVLDDGVMTSGKDFTFESIEQVAQNCLPFVLNIAQKHRQGDQKMAIVLAGWSYGGVVASVVAKLLAGLVASASAAAADPPGSTVQVQVNALILFDSPLRDPRASAACASDSDSVHTQVAAPAAAAAAPPAVVGDASTTGAAAAFDVQHRTQVHFSACTDLLRAFYSRAAEEQFTSSTSPPPLTCRVLDVRPEQTDYDCGPEAVTALTTGEVRRTVVPGTHWTMLFQENAAHVAKNIQSFL